MWTISYKGLYIHGYCDKDVCRVTAADGMSIARNCKSLHAAKLAATKHLKSV
ncbi:uncharacterized protein NMK_2120 [Novimethylophilus kurashikiensis]|uniref:Uncharacterized protein n=1 Tax=Novimethylophilus kurashikiensis TaxID=1825523 RepID=A0A2R5FCT4_9PROT|nr:uncharacterized protein NMK_2120 [Novimethylophilus kurashikiensis]